MNRIDSKFAHIDDSYRQTQHEGQRLRDEPPRFIRDFEAALRRQQFNVEAGKGHELVQTEKLLRPRELERRKHRDDLQEILWTATTTTQRRNYYTLQRPQHAQHRQQKCQLVRRLTHAAYHADAEHSQIQSTFAQVHRRRDDGDEEYGSE